MNINLMLGDCLERMKEIPDVSVDMILIDSPLILCYNT
jgi:DNA modification methylase